ncbi:GntR family transcriptional regulator [soil metagenome]
MQSMAVTRHPPIRDQIASTLRAAIVNLDFKPGQLLIERDLCERTGASRPSVREALRQLEAEGLVESRNGKGTVVRVLTVQEATDVYEVRAELEGLAARLFCERADPAQFAALQKATDSLRAEVGQGGDSSTILEAQKVFYQVLFEGAGNPFLDDTVRGIQVRVSQLRAMTLSVPGRLAESLAEFEEIASEVANKRGAAAQRAAARHVKRAAAVMATAVEQALRD